MRFGAPVDTMPQLRVIKPTGFEYDDDWYRLERTERGDSLVYWITDSALIKNDTITVAARYLRMDSTDNIVWHADTLKFGYTKPNWLVKQEQEEIKAYEQNTKRLGQLREKIATGKDVDSTEVVELEKALLPKVLKTEVEFVKRGTLEVYDSIKIKTNEPLSNIDMNLITLEMRHDSVWKKLSMPKIVPATDIDLMTFVLPMKLEPDSSYRMTFNVGAITSIYGHLNDSLASDFKIKPLEEYSTLFVHVNVKDHAFIELLGSGEKVERTAGVVNGKALFENVIPGSYYLRLTLDRNDNGRWDTGNYGLHLQPEEVYYYPKTVKLRSNWDVEQQWNIYETALDLQKPDAIKKNKPDKRKNSLEKEEKKKNGDENEEEDDEFNSSGFGNSSYSGDKYRDYQNNRRSQGGSGNRNRLR